MIFKPYYILYLFLFISFSYSQNISTSFDDIASIDSARIISSANMYLNEKAITVTAEHSDRSVGGNHDYYSEGDYWWPNPQDPNGPYIRKDGMTNPENFTAHRKAMRRLSLIVPSLVAAYKITDDRKYADSALTHLLAWFVNEKTRMNPNLLYAQAIKGKVTGRGIGIIDTIHLVEVVQAILFLEKISFFKPDQLLAIKQWFKEYLEWITTHPYGHKERDNGNNHSTCWAMQVAAFAKLTGNNQQMDYVRTMFKDVLVPDQMALDGSFPKEIKRTKPYGYMLFNLDAMAMVCMLASDKNDLWNFKLADGRGIQKAMQFMFPYIADKSSWPFQKDVMYFDKWPVRHPSLLFAGIVYNNQAYLDLWKTLNPDPKDQEIIRNYPIRQPILWVK
ncbi:MAG: alginate lyase [Calditrichaeota bacterium]|nr:MAG: alginate lyase [Calditrichota bacterium]MBL1205593.1 alginate lyase [Calditrichota bacterium]NOG45422.1 alginate lyase family protein [Calditrichota bacterium]